MMTTMTMFHLTTDNHVNYSLRNDFML